MLLDGTLLRNIVFQAQGLGGQTRERIRQDGRTTRKLRCNSYKQENDSQLYHRPTETKISADLELLPSSSFTRVEWDWQSIERSRSPTLLHKQPELTLKRLQDLLRTRISISSWQCSQTQTFAINLPLRGSQLFPTSK